VQLSIVRDLDKYENELMPGTALARPRSYFSVGTARGATKRSVPKCVHTPVSTADATLSSNLVNFGKVKFGVPSIVTLTLENTGQVRNRLIQS